MKTILIWILVSHGGFNGHFFDAYKNPYSNLKFASKSDCIDAAQKVSIENATYTCESIKVLAK